MADANSSSSPVLGTRNSPTSKKDDLRPIGDKISDLNDSQSELLSRLQIMKQDLQDWRTKLDTQVKTYKEVNILTSIHALKIGCFVKSINEPYALKNWRRFSVRFRKRARQLADGKELTELNKTLNSDLEQLKSGLQQLRATLQQQQDHISDNLRNLRLEDGPEGSQERETEVKEHPVAEMEVPLLDRTSDSSSEGDIADTSA